MIIRALSIALLAFLSTSPLAFAASGTEPNPSGAGTSGSSTSLPNPYVPPNNSTGGGEILINPLGYEGGAVGLQSFLERLLDFAITIGSIVIVIMMVYIGFMFVTAQGNETKITNARKALEWTVLGALLLLGAKVIAEGIRATVQALSVGG